MLRLISARNSNLALSIHSGTENIFVCSSHKAYPTLSEQLDSRVQYVMSHYRVLFEVIESRSDLSLFGTCVDGHDDDDVYDDTENRRIVMKASLTPI